MALRIPWEEALLGGGTYNGLDTGVGKTDSTGTKNYMRDGVGVTAPVLSDSAAVYTPGISERRSGTTKYLHSGLKNAGAQSSTAQAVTATRQYDAFGNVASSTGTWSGPFGYAGGFGYKEDPDTGLKLLGHRYYDSSTGRFLSRDPAKDGRNWYSYCAGNPIRGVDPFGLSCWGAADDYWTSLSAWWSGNDVIGPRGELVRVGGWHAAFFNSDGIAMTVNGTVHLNDDDDYADYVNSFYWSAHERRHLYQCDEWFGGSSILFVGTTAVEYVVSCGHDGAYIEMEATEHGIMESGGRYP